jgi:UDP-glucose 4-epimerase
MPSSILHPPSSHILITGGAGFIGSHLTDRLLAAGSAVTVIDDLSTGNRANLQAAEANPHFRFVQARLSEYSQLEALVGESDQVFHLAAAVGVDLVVREPVRTLETNLHETEVLLETAAHHRIPVLLASTSEVYGKSTKDVFSEDDDLLIGPPTHSRWSYACSKLMDEFLALAYTKERALPVVITRLFNTVGPRQTGQYGMVLPRFIAAAVKNEPLRVYGDGQQSRCFCGVNDCVEALVRLSAIPAAHGHIFNVGATSEITIADLARLVIATLGSKSPLDFIPYNEAYEPGFDDMRRRKPSVEKLAQFTSFRAQTALPEIIRQIAAVNRG